MDPNKDRFDPNKDRFEADSSGTDGLVNDSFSKVTDQDGVPKRQRCGHKRINSDELPEDERRKLHLRRSYNRKCAAKARKRSKELIADLQRQVEELKEDKAALKRHNEVMRAQMEVMSQQNRTLMMNQQLPQGSLVSQHNPFQGNLGGMESLAQSLMMGSTSANSEAADPNASLLETLAAQRRLQQMSGHGGTPGASGGMDPNKFYR